jgi:pimeloyl-ACP methyl ester carboxylesterase
LATTEQILTLLATLLSGNADSGAFDHLKDGGADTRYPVSIEACPAPIPTYDIEGDTVICGTVNVPENHAKLDGNRIDLRFSVLKARSKAARPDPVVYLHGGPGGNAVPDSAWYDEIFAELRSRRDIVLFDQRASGISAQTITCFETLADTLFVAAAEGRDDVEDPTSHCLREIEAKGVVLADYNTTQNAFDVRAIMSALGYPTYNIYGISYGTLLGQEVLRSAPEGVRAAVLDSIVLTDVPAYDTNGVATDKAIGAVVDQCAADETCHAAFPDLEQTLKTAFERLGNEPIPATALRPEIDDGQLLLTLRGRNQNRIPNIDDFLPQIISEWAEGNSTTYDLLVGGSIQTDWSATSIKREFAGEVDDTSLAIAYSAALQAEQMDSISSSLKVLLARLQQDGSTVRLPATIEPLLDSAIEEEMGKLDRDTILAMARSYGRFASSHPDRQQILDWLGTYFADEPLDRLKSIVQLMDEGDIAAFGTRAAADTNAIYAEFTSGFDLEIYACQESIPFNTREGYDAVAANYRFPIVAEAQGAVRALYDACEAFTPSPRAGFHEPFTSTEIPVLAVSGLNDTQTDGDAAEMLAERLDGARPIVFPRSGHGVIIFSQCAKDVTAAFIDAPTEPVDVTCVDALRPNYYIPQ